VNLSGFYSNKTAFCVTVIDVDNGLLFYCQRKIIGIGLISLLKKVIR
jgi:hypothetical protein